MPIAVTGGSEHFQLRSLEGGFVEIKRMTHGQKLQRGSFTDKMKFSSSKKSKDMQGEMDLMQRSVTLWEWANVIGDHNLECYVNPLNPEQGTRLLNLKDIRDCEAVDARIAEEISTYISRVNNFEDDLDDEDTLLGKSA